VYDDGVLLGSKLHVLECGAAGRTGVARLMSWGALKPVMAQSMRRPSNRRVGYTDLGKLSTDGEDE
jgi:hypothetical protein